MILIYVVGCKNHIKSVTELWDVENRDGIKQIEDS